MQRDFAYMVAAELSSARSKYPRTQASTHEGFAVLLEEVDEVKSEVWKKPSMQDNVALLKELVQVAAMAQRMAEDAGLV